MDQEARKRNLQHVQQLRLALGGTKPSPKAVQEDQGCQHQRTAVARYQAKHGGHRWVEMCIDCGEVTRFGLTTHAAQVRALELSPVVQDYIPNPELAEMCCMSGCDRLATMQHHPLPEHVYGQSVSSGAGTVPVCADCHARLHRLMKHRPSDAQ